MEDGIDTRPRGCEQCVICFKPLPASVPQTKFICPECEPVDVAKREPPRRGGGSLAFVVPPDLTEVFMRECVTEPEHNSDDTETANDNRTPPVQTISEILASTPCVGIAILPNGTMEPIRPGRADGFFQVQTVSRKPPPDRSDGA